MLSLDEIRRERKLDPADSKHTAEAVRLGKEQAKEYLRARTSFVFNATNLNRDLRQQMAADVCRLRRTRASHLFGMCLIRDCYHKP